MNSSILSAKSLADLLKRVQQIGKQISTNPSNWGAGYMNGAPACQFLNNIRIADPTIAAFIRFIVAHWVVLFPNNRINDEGVSQAKTAFDAVSKQKVSCAKTLAALKQYARDNIN